MDRRLQTRYFKLVKSHMRTVPSSAAGIKSMPDTSQAFAATQAAWRFLNNERVTMPALGEPLRQAGRESVAESHSDYALVVHDWSMLNFGKHTSKQDRLQRTHEGDVGYDLYTALLVDANTGSPLAPMALRLRTAHEILDTEAEPLCETVHLEQIGPTMQAAEAWNLPRQLVHVVDREGSSVGHFRDWNAAGHCFLVRSDERNVMHRGQERKLSAIPRLLKRDGCFEYVRDVEMQGRQRCLWVAEEEVVLHRPAKHWEGDRQVERPGYPLAVRLVVARLTDHNGRKVAEWWLLTNVAAEVSGVQIAEWYYWRWQIESYFKLVKTGGCDIERWEQESGPAIARRLCVAAMACVVAWRLERAETPETREASQVLVRLSGRQMKRSRPVTASAVLAGLMVFLPMLELLEHHDVSTLKAIASQILPWADTS